MLLVKDSIIINSTSDNLLYQNFVFFTKPSEVKEPKVLLSLFYTYVPRMLERDKAGLVWHSQRIVNYICVEKGINYVFISEIATKVDV